MDEVLLVKGKFGLFALSLNHDDAMELRGFDTSLLHLLDVSFSYPCGEPVMVALLNDPIGLTHLILPDELIALVYQ